MGENNENKKFLSVQNLGYLSTMGVLFLALGLIISTQTQRHMEAERARLPVERQLNGLVALLKETQNKKADLEKQFTKLKQQVHILSRDSMSNDLSNRQLQNLYQIAGLTTMKGEGIIIKLNDQDFGKSIKNTGLANNDGLIHSDDLLKLINELKASGAKAIAINDQRLVTTSEIVTAGSNILVNESKLAPPYIIKAIGPSNTMTSALKMRGGIVEYLEVFGIKVEILRESSLKLPAYNKGLT